MRIILLFTLILAAAAVAQDKPAVPPAFVGIDAGSGIHYAMLSVEGKSLGPAQPATPPRLTAQCTKDAAGKLRFELLVDEGGAPPLEYIPPFKSTSDTPFAPPVEAVIVTMEYLGYVKEKPVKRQWDRVHGLSSEFKYATPAMTSKNLEEVTRCLQYLRSLPRLHLAFPGRPLLEFETATWQARVHAEPLCGASGL